MSEVPGFLPSSHGLHFANRFAAAPTVRLGPFDPRWIGIGDASAGLCGGMAWYVRERFEAGLPIPPDTEAPANGTALFRALVRRQVQSLDWMRTPIRFWWMGAKRPGDAARDSHEHEWPIIRTTIEGGHLAVVGLIRHRGLNPFRLTESHQVLAYAAETVTEDVTIRIYDPNWPDRDDVSIVADPAGVRQSTGETLYGFLRI